MSGTVVQLTDAMALDILQNCPTLAENIGRILLRMQNEDNVDWGIEMTKDEELAVHQLIGFAHASKGFDVLSLAESMGLTANEFTSIHDGIKSSLKQGDLEELEQHFKYQK